MIELIASVNLPPSAPGITDVTQSSQQLFEQSSISWSESSSTGRFNYLLLSYNRKKFFLLSQIT